MVLEIKGMDDSQNKEKRRYLAEWVDVVNEDGRYGTWTCDVAFNPSEVREIIIQHIKTKTFAEEYVRCPKCDKDAQSKQDIDKEFGFCNVDGITKPQSWCRKCRKE